jgi:hypothetical protein
MMKTARQKITVAKIPNPAGREQAWKIERDGVYVGYIRKFSDTRTDTSPYQVFTLDPATKDTLNLICNFWPTSVPLTGMNGAKHRHGKFLEVKRFAREYFGGTLSRATF